MIVRPVFRATWAELLHLPVRLGLVLCMLAPDWLFAILGKHPTLNPGKGLWFALILGAGLIGRPASNGTLALLLSRPVRRADYVLTRWLAVSAIASLVAAGNLLLLGLLQGIKSGSVPWDHMLLAAAEDILGATGMAAVLAMLSSLVSGIGDAALLGILILSAAVMQQLGAFLSKPSLTWIGHHLDDWLVPRLDLETTFRSSPISWLAIFAYLSTVTLCIAGAIELMRRREISYAGHGD